jgi:hypothetical protein
VACPPTLEKCDGKTKPSDRDKIKTALDNLVRAMEMNNGKEDKQGSSNSEGHEKSYEIGGKKYKKADAYKLLASHANQAFEGRDAVVECSNGGYYFWGFNEDEVKQIKVLLNEILLDKENYNTEYANAIFRLGKNSNKAIIFYKFKIANNAFAMKRNLENSGNGVGTDALILFDLENLKQLEKKHEFNGVEKLTNGNLGPPRTFNVKSSEVIFHELIHAVKFTTGLKRSSIPDGTKFDTPEEKDTIIKMNNVRLKWNRTDHR